MRERARGVTHPLRLTLAPCRRIHPLSHGLNTRLTDRLAHGLLIPGRHTRRLLIPGRHDHRILIAGRHNHRLLITGRHDRRLLIPGRHDRRLLITGRHDRRLLITGRHDRRLVRHASRTGDGVGVLWLGRARAAQAVDQPRARHAEEYPEREDQNDQSN
ncbi:MAG TPA: hypothetical protein VNV17_01745, partial [Solirubrobacteraceae bacterium]|nr:hypothetical protein [Solirubrobacteraceae bacterium]